MDARYLALILLSLAGLVNCDDSPSPDDSSDDSSDDQLVRIPLEPASLFGYVAQIEIGTPPQTFNVVVDTGSSDLWVGHKNLCKTSTYCLNHTVYNNTASKTYKMVEPSEIHTISYSAGNALVYTVRDDVRFGNKEYKNIKIGAVVASTGDISKNHNADGVLGVSFLKSAKIKHDYPDTTNFLDFPLYSVYLARRGEKGSQLIIGGSDPNLYEGELKYIPVIGDKRLTVQMNSFNVNGVEICETPCEILIDTGSGGFVVPNTKYVEIFKHIDPYVQCGQFENHPSINIKLDEYMFPIEAEYYMLPENNPEFPGRCQFFGSGENDTIGMWMIGDTFLRKYYTEYDLTNKRIGMALAKHP